MDSDLARPGVLDRVVHRGNAGEVDGAFDLPGVAPDVPRQDADCLSGVPPGGYERRTQSLVRKEGRVDAVGELSKLVDRLLDLPAKAIQNETDLVVPAFTEPLGRDAQLNRQASEPLLGAVVLITLDLLARRHLRSNKPLTDIPLSGRHRGR